MWIVIDTNAVVATQLHHVAGHNFQLDLVGQTAATSGSGSGSYGVRTTFRGPPAEGCRLCQDVAHTFRSQFPCPGNKDPSMSFYVKRAKPGRGKSPNFDVIPTANTCGHVGNCNIFQEGPRRTACLVLRKTFQLTSRREEIAEWFKSQSEYTQMRPDYNIGNVQFDPASAQGNTRKAPGWFAHEFCRDNNFCDDASACTTALQNGQCRDDPHCPAAWKECGIPCAACYWVVKTFPNFVKACSILDTPAPGNANSGLRPSGREGSAPVPRGLNSPPLEDELITFDTNFKRLSVCFAMWNEFTQSPKARYLVQYVDRLGHLPWQPKLVCQCLGKCVMDGFESLAMHSACAYHEYNAVNEMLFPDLSDTEILNHRIS